MNFFEFNKKFPSQIACIQHFIHLYYEDGAKCRHCNHPKVYHRKDLPKKFDCTHCRNSFSIFKGTIMEKSRTDLRKWLYAIHLFLNSKKGVSGYQLQREIGVTYKTAWRMLKQIRLAMGNREGEGFKGLVFEMDETYVGGKPRKGNKRDDDEPKNKTGRGTKKEAVVGVLDRDNKEVFAQVMKKNKDGKKLTGKQLLEVLNQIVSQQSILISDEFKGYNILKHKTNHLHFRIDHSKQFTDGDIHTNNIENFWGTLKRGILGIYHHVSCQHLQKYLDEFCFRYNNRKNADAFNLVLKQAKLN
jgi:transposase-like protein